MRALVASSTKESPAEAVLEIGERLRAQGLDPSDVDPERTGAALVFVSVHLAREPAALASALKDVLGRVPFVGFVGASAIHDARLRERKPALTVLVLPGVGARARTAALEGNADDVAAQLLAEVAPGRARFLACALDPATASGSLDFLRELDEQGVPIAGCLCAAPSGQRPAVIFPGAGPGARAALLDVDGVRLVCGTAQAARQLGPVRAVTAATSNLIQELDGRPAFEALVADLPAPLRQQIPSLGGALCAGFGTEDGDGFLMRHVVGVDPQTGAVAVAGRPRVGTEIVFSLRDAKSAREDMDDMLNALQESLGNAKPRAYVVFTCVGRDERLMGAPMFDAQTVLARFGTDVPVVGVAGSGELCTYGAGTYLFGMSCVVAAVL